MTGAMVAQAREALGRRQLPAVLPLALGGVAVALLIGRWVALGDSEQLTLGGVALGAAVVALITLASWRAGVYFFLLWIVFEDLPRKFLGNNLLVSLSKDALVVVAYGSFLYWTKRRRMELFRPPFLVPLLVFIGLGAVQMFNPNAPSIFYGLAGMRLYFAYVLLMLLGYALLRSPRDLEGFLAFNLGLAGIVAGLGIAQAIIGPGFLNPAILAPELEPLGRLFREAPISGEILYRPTSVFVSDGRFAWYLLAMLFLGIGGIGFLLLRRSAARSTWLAVIVGVGLVSGAIAMSGSRGTIMYALGSVLVLAAAFARGAPAGSRRTRFLAAAPRVLVPAGVVLALLLVLYPEALEARWAFYYETIAPWSSRSELAYRLADYPLSNFFGAFAQPNWLLGNGIGTASLGVQYVVGLLGAEPPQVAVESGYGVLLLELGILGPLLWLAWTGALVWSGWRVVRRLRGTPLFPIGFAILWFTFVLLFPLTYGGIQPYQNFIFNAYLWLLVGILFRLPELAHQERVTSGG